MLSKEDIDTLTVKKLCYHCVGEDYLNAEVQCVGKRSRCSYCGRLAKSYTIGDLAERIEQVFEAHYRRTLNHPDLWQQTLLSDRELDYEWDRDGEPIIQAIANAANMPEVAAKDIQTILEHQYSDFECLVMGEETEFSSGSYYEQKGTSDRTWQEEWIDFEHSLKTEARHFSRTAATRLKLVFDGIDGMYTTDGRPLLIDAGPGTSLSAIYRACAFQSDERLLAALCRPDEQLGPPPARLAVAGRMNARGISVFYAANEVRVAIAEVRPPVGSQVAVARFEIVRALRLLDLTALSAVGEDGSVFDPSLAARMARAMFLRSLSQRITRPVMPDDEAFEYLSTQAIADFLATEDEPFVDGMVFPSAQAAGSALNVVLFHKAAQVEAILRPEGTVIEARTGQMYEEGWETEYVVVEETPTRPTSAVTAADDEECWSLAALADEPWIAPDLDCREPTLRIDIDSIKVHVVQRVDFGTVEHDVRRHRWERGQEEDF